MRTFLSFILYSLTRLINFTYRYRYINKSVFENSKREKGFHFVALWHQNAIATIFAHPKESYLIMASNSKDGELIAKALKWLGHKLIRGSSHRGGAEALIQMVSEAQKLKMSCALTVDGPRGPARKVKRGIIEMARLTGAPIQGVLALPRSYFSFNSWDKFRLPKPFTIIDVYYAEPFFVEENVTAEQFLSYQQKLEHRLNTLEKENTRER